MRKFALRLGCILPRNQTQLKIFIHFRVITTRCRMPTIRVKENERFKRTIEKSGLLTELRAREFYEKPTAERKRKKAAAVKRHYKRLRSMMLPKKLY